MKRLSLVIIFLLLVCCKKDGCTDPRALNFNINATKDDGSCLFQEYRPNLINTSITEDKTLSSDTIWELDGRISVLNGATLTIEPGTIIKAHSGSGSASSCLLISQEGKINAVGTRDQPIIFTTLADDIQIGEVISPNLSASNKGMWGGVILLGKAPGSFIGNVTQCQIEGIPVTDENGLMGGNNPNHNSGVMQYVSIRHCGTDIGAGNEINALTLGGVGDSTIINNIEIYGTTDDGVEFFGGTVNASNLFIYGQGDDGIDIDCGYSGRISNSTIIQHGGDHFIEVDGPEGVMTASFELDSIYLYGDANGCDRPSLLGEIAHFRDGALGVSKNIWCVDFGLGADVELEQDVSNNYLNNSLVFENWNIQKPLDHNGDTCTIISLNDIYKDKGGSSFAQDASSWTNFINNGNNIIDSFISKEFSWTFYKNK